MPPAGRGPAGPTPAGRGPAGPGPGPADLALAGRVATGDGDPVRGEVLITGGRITAVQPPGGDGAAARRIDVGSAYLLPGGIDCHVHSGSHPGEGLSALTRAAAAGGVTTVVDMPYDADAPVVDPEVLAAKRARVAAEALVDVALLATVARGAGAGAVAPLVEAGAVGFKLSLFCTDIHRFPRIPDDQLIEVLAAIAAAGSVACVHAENEEIIKPRIEAARRRGEGSPLAHCRSRPPVSETQAVLTALEYAREAGARLHLCHLSLPRSVDLAAAYRAGGSPVTMETCPHYLVFSEDDMARQGGRLKINPPLRAPGEVDGMWQRVRAGTVDAIASDHAPWPLQDKAHPDIFDNHSGAPGVETLVPAVAAGLLHRGGTVQDLVELLSAGPARIFGLADRKGSLRPGMDADVVAYDPSPTPVDERRLHSNAGWSPYHGMAFGRVRLTVSRGEVVWDGAEVAGDPGRGLAVGGNHG